ncbi:MAG TPA: hypothetical protein VGO52_21605 [Hyphomonadaceae bacterium]|nr:hypothetical protein [Hyphomonadaceae bacterium]
MRKGFEGKEIELGIYNEHELLSMKTELESIGFKVRIDQYKPPDGA